MILCNCNHNYSSYINTTITTTIMIVFFHLRTRPRTRTRTRPQVMMACKHRLSKNFMSCVPHLKGLNPFIYLETPGTFGASLSLCNFHYDTRIHWNRGSNWRSPLESWSTCPVVTGNAVTHFLVNLFTLHWYIVHR